MLPVLEEKELIKPPQERSPILLRCADANVIAAIVPLDGFFLFRI